MARGRPGGGSKEHAPAENEIATGSALAPNGNGPAKAYRHKGEKRRNIPPAAIAGEGKMPTAPKLNYSYSPRLDPILRFDPMGAPDKLPDLLEKAKREPLTEAEARLLAEALRRQEPWLEWAGKRESNGFAVDPVALHIHERVSTQAILKIAARKDVTRDLFADPQFDYHQAVQFYRHEMDWSNRLILGDSLQVMASLAQREDLAGKVQMIYVDPPYGIKFASNFQPKITSKNVKDKEQDLTVSARNGGKEGHRALLCAQRRLGADDPLRVVQRGSQLRARLPRAPCDSRDRGNGANRSARNQGHADGRGQGKARSRPAVGRRREQLGQARPLGLPSLS